MLKKKGSNDDHWQQHAAQWHLLGSPLRPCFEDTRLFEEIVRSWAVAAGCSRPLALLLGVTPELADMGWPPETRLLAVDHCLGMIAKVWPKNAARAALAVRGEWQALPLAAGTTDIVLGDGCFTLLSYPGGAQKVIVELAEILSPRGCLALRLFVRPRQRERVDQVFADLQEGQISSFHALKWRLAMALHGPTAEDGVRLADVWQVWQDAPVDKAAIISERGWSPTTMATIDNYQGRSARYTFPTLEEIRRAFSPYFQEEACLFGQYELAQRCPILVFSPKNKRS